MYMPAAQSFAAAETVRCAMARLPGLAPVAFGLVAGTRIETSAGWRPAEALAPGDLVQTLDGGQREIHRIERLRLGGAAGPVDLVMLPDGALGTCAGALLLPGQPLLVETGPAARILDALAALVPAAALDGIAGCRLIRRTAPVEVVRPFLAEDEVIFANTSLALWCPGAGGDESGFFPRLDALRGRALLELVTEAPAWTTEPPLAA